MSEQAANPRSALSWGVVNRYRPLLLLPLLALGGCVGWGGRRGGTETGARFVGAWSGTYAESASGGHGGTLTVSITYQDDAGRRDEVSGSLADAAAGAGSVNGTIDASGDGQLFFTYGTADGSPFTTYTGKASIDSHGHLVASLVYYVDGVAQTNRLDLAPAVTD